MYTLRLKALMIFQTDKLHEHIMERDINPTSETS